MKAIIKLPNPKKNNPSCDHLRLWWSEYRILDLAIGSLKFDLVEQRKITSFEIEVYTNNFYLRMHTKLQDTLKELKEGETLDSLDGTLSHYIKKHEQSFRKSLNYLINSSEILIGYYFDDEIIDCDDTEVINPSIAILGSANETDSLSDEECDLPKRHDVAYHPSDHMSRNVLKDVVLKYCMMKFNTKPEICFDQTLSKRQAKKEFERINPNGWDGTYKILFTPEFLEQLFGDSAKGIDEPVEVCVKDGKFIAKYSDGRRRPLEQYLDLVKKGSS